MNTLNSSYARRGLLVRLTYLSFAIIYSILIGFGRISRGHAVVLCYHEVTRAQLSRFRKQMQWIVRRAVKLTDLSERTDKKDKICVTFDDAYECILGTVIPVTRELSIPIAIFAVTNNMGDTPRWEMEENSPYKIEKVMTNEQLLAADKEDHCLIGSHSVNHYPLGRIELDIVHHELVDSKAALEKLLGHEVTVLALPHGSYTNQVISAAIEAGYQWILTLNEISNPSKWPSGTVGRFSVSPDMWMIEFQLTVIGAYAWLFPWRSLLRCIHSKLKES